MLFVSESIPIIVTLIEIANTLVKVGKKFYILICPFIGV